MTPRGVVQSCAKFKDRRKYIKCSALLMSAAVPEECLVTHKEFVAELSVCFSIILKASLDRKVTQLHLKGARFANRNTCLHVFTAVFRF